MEEFRVVAKIKYNNSNFFVLINSNCQKYFVKELEDGSISYPTEDEYNELNNIFSKKLELAFLKIGKNYKIEPKVITKVGSAVVLSSLLIAFGAPAITNLRNKELIENLEQERINIKEELREKGYEFYRLSGYENSGLYLVHKAVAETTGVNIINCQNFEEFSQYITTKKNPTYNELRETLINNKNVDSKYKQWLLEGIDNLEKCMPDLNLTVLNFNFNRLQLEVTTLEKMQEESNEELLVGRFDQITGKACFIDTDNEIENKFIVYHEVLGHGVSEAVINQKIDDCFEKIVMSDSIFVMRMNIYDKENEFFYVGQGQEEGKADQIAKLAMGNYSIKGHPYIEQSEQLRIISKTINLTLEDYISNGGTEILNRKMQEENVNNSLTYILANDLYVDAMRNNTVELLDSENTFKENILAFFKDYAEEKIKNGESSKNIVEEFSQILFEKGDYIRSTFNMEEINYNELKKDIEKMSKSIERE